MAAYSSERSFVDCVRPILEAGDLDTLVPYVQRQWPNIVLRELLFADDEEAV